MRRRPWGLISSHGSAALLPALVLCAGQLEAQQPSQERRSPRPPVIDMHLHAMGANDQNLGYEQYRARLSSALLLEDVVARHPRLRVYVMHAGYPLLDDVMALLYAHPQVYVEVGVIVYSRPRTDFYRYLEAPFLSDAQKRAILYHNAARFLRLTEDEQARHFAAGRR